MRNWPAVNLMNHRIRTFCFLFIFYLPALTAVGQERSLDYYISEGVVNSPLLRDLGNQVSASSIDSLIVLAGKKPRIEWKSQLLYSPYNDHFGYDEVITDGGNYEAVGYISQNIFNRRYIENEMNSINTQKKNLNLGKKLSLAELKRTITSLYIASFSVYSDLMFNRSFLDLMIEQNSLVEKLVKAGIYSQSDYLALRVETDGQKVLVRQLGNQYRSSVRMLNEACGIIDTLDIILEKPDIKPVEILNDSHYLLLEPYIIDSIRIINEKNALLLRYKPTVTWFADAGILTSNPWNFYRHLGASAGISLNFPIFDGHQKNLEEKKLAFRENTRSYYNLYSRKQYDQQYLRLKDELAGIREVRSQMEGQLEASGLLVNSLRSELEAGIIRMTDFLNALKGHRTINHNINMADIEVMNIMNEMNYLLAK
jgi:outer membrane protein TolC